MVEVARKYGISSVMLKKICRKLDVPTPPRGYWAKVRAGKSVHKPKLSDSATRGFVIGKGLDEDEMAHRDPRDPLSLFEEAVRKKVFLVAEGIEHHPKARLRPILSEMKHRGCLGTIMRVNHPQYYSFDDFVSTEQASRSMSMMETIARAVESIGGCMSGPLEIQAFGERVSLEIRERTVNESHALTANEKKAISRYEKTKNDWDKPNIRKWDKRFTGMLSISVLTGVTPYMNDRWNWTFKTVFSERDDMALEQQLDEVFLAICRVCAAKRLHRLEVESEAEAYTRKVVEAQREVDAFNTEIDRLRNALEESERFDAASKLRSYAKGLVSGKSGPDRGYAAWIMKKADWLDPTIGLSDVVFGTFARDGAYPQKKENVRTALPYRIDFFFKRNGRTPNQTWQQLIEACGD